MEKSKNSNFVYALLALTAGLYISIISIIYTFQMYKDLGYNSIDGFLTGGIGIMFDLGKVVFPVLIGLAIAKKQWGKIIAFGILLLFCLTNSFVASQGRDLNVSAIYQAEADGNSSIKANNDKAIKAKEIEINTVTATINSLITEKNSMPKNYITAKKNKQKEIDIQNNKLTALNKELTALTSKSYTRTGTVTKGLYQLAKYFNNENPEKAIGTISIIKNIAQEVLAIAFLIAFGILKKKENEPENNKPIPYSDKIIGSDNITVNQIDSKNYTPLDDRIKTKKTIGFINDNTTRNLSMTELKAIPKNNNVLEKGNTELKTGMTQDEHKNIDNKEFNFDDIKEYIDYMYKNSKNNISVGVAKILKNTNLNNKQVRGIKFYLEKIGVIKNNETNTIILCNYDNALQKIQ